MCPTVIKTIMLFYYVFVYCLNVFLHLFTNTVLNALLLCAAIFTSMRPSKNVVILFEKVINILEHGNSINFIK